MAGTSPPSFARAFPSPAAFLEAFDAEIARGGLMLPGAVAAVTAMAACRVSVQVAEDPPVEVDARVAAVVQGVGVAVVFDGVPAALAELADQLRAPAPRGLAADRIRGMVVGQKIQLALHGDREERFALLRDTNKTLHPYVLRNPRITLEEVLFAARSPALSPLALAQIAEHREWGMNPAVCLALVRNARTPTPTGLRLLDLIPERELRKIAKGGAPEALVQAARRKAVG